MEYPIALGILTVYFAIIGFLVLRKKDSPEPPPKGSVQPEEARKRVSFKTFYRERAAQRREAITAQRRIA